MWADFGTDLAAALLEHGPDQMPFIGLRRLLYVGAGFAAARERRFWLAVLAVVRPLVAPREVPRRKGDDAFFSDTAPIAGMT